VRVTECNKCGDCCERITVGWEPERLLNFVGVSDPRDDAAWERWKAVDPEHYTDEARDGYVRTWLNANFLFEHWHIVARSEAKTTFSCDAFDAEARLCTAHDGRPPICSGFPWYGKTTEELGPVASAARLKHFGDADGLRGLPRCEFWADLEPELRPEGWEPVLLTTRPIGAA
jgi:Fe-S-cluster containining protein